MENSALSKGATQASNRMKWILLLSTVLLSVLTFIAMMYIDRFSVETEQMLQDGDFALGNSHWKEDGIGLASFQDKQLKIINRPGISHSVFQNVEVETPAFYRFSYNAGTNEVVPTSPEEWALASIAVIFRDDGGERTGSKMITTLSGTQPSTAFSEQLLLDESIASVDVAARLYRAGGEFFVTEPVMARLEEIPFFKGVRIAVVVSWFVLAAVIAYFGFRALRIWQMLFLFALTGAALIGTMMPDVLVTSISQKTAGMLPESLLNNSRVLLSKLYGEDKFAHAGAEVSKLGHLLVFACFGFVAGLMWRKCGIYYAFAGIMALAVSTEALQTLVYGRTTNAVDLFVDAVGGITGLWLGFTLASVAALVRRDHSSETKIENINEGRFR